MPSGRVNMHARDNEVSDAVKEQVRSRLNIVQLLGGYVKLRQMGKSLVGLCPFHQEKTPSFYVDPAKGLYHCFGCKAGGDVFDFVMQVEGLTFPEALRFLAQKAGVDVPQASGLPGEAQRHRDTLLEVNRIAQAYYQRTLQGPAGSVARSYLVQRGVQPATARRYGLGYATGSWDGLSSGLKHTGKEEAGLAAGLLVERRSGGTYDRFRDRIMFPLVSAAGDVVAFGGRSLGKEEPKYLNSPETPVYVKRHQLYGFYHAKEAIRRFGRVLVVEGYFDCVMLHQSGIGYAVATCGTALTREHVELLRRLADNLYLCFDADAAGRKATTTAQDLLNLDSRGLAVRVVTLPEGHDPDSFLRQEGRDAFLAELERAIPFTDYLLEEAFRQADMNTVAGRMRGVRAALPILQQLKSPVERDAYTRRVAIRLGVSAESLAVELAGQQRGNQRPRHTNLGNRNTSRDLASVTAHASGSPRALLEREMVRCLLRDPAGAREVVATLGDAPFRTESYNEVLRALAQGRTGHQQDGEMPPGVAAVQLPAGESALTWQDCLRKIRVEQLRDELEAMEEGLAALVDHNPAQYLMRMKSSLLAFRRWRKALREQSPGQPRAS